MAGIDRSYRSSIALAVLRTPGKRLHNLQFAPFRLLLLPTDASDSFLKVGSRDTHPIGGGIGHHGKDDVQTVPGAERPQRLARR